MSDQFNDPQAPGQGIDWKAYNGNLLIVDVHGVKTGIATVHGLSDAVSATVTIADGPETGRVYADTLIFPKILQSQTSSKVGSKILGRLGQGVAKPGQSAPWMLNPATDADKAQAGQVLAQFAGAGLQAPVQQQAPQGPAPQAYVPPQGQPPVQQFVPQQQAPAPTY